MRQRRGRLAAFIGFVWLENKKLERQGLEADSVPHAGREVLIQRSGNVAFDDRSRSIEDDPLAKETSPPEPDKTAYKEGQGFTGMEALASAQAAKPT